MYSFVSCEKLGTSLRPTAPDRNTFCNCSEMAKPHDLVCISSSSAPMYAERRAALLDHCWGVLFGVGFSAFLLVMVSSCLGYMTMLFKERYLVNHEEASWVSTTMVITSANAGLLVSVMQQKISIYRISLIGGYMASVGLVASAFAPSIAWMTFTFGVIYGTGMGIALLGLCLYLLLYFEEYRGTATAIMWLFRAASGMAGTRLLWCLTEAYGMQGCLLITGGLVSHVVPLVMLIRRPKPWRLHVLGITRATQRCKHSYEEIVDVDTKEKLVCSQPKMQSRYYDNSEENPTGTVWTTMKSFKSLSFYVLVLYSVISEYVFLTFAITMVAYTVDKGWTLETGNQIVVYNSVGHLLGRAVVPYASDKIRRSRCPIAVGTFSIAAICFLLMPMVRAFGSLVALTILLGVAQGYIMCIKTVLIADYMPVAQVSFCCGMGGVISIPVWLCGPSVIGYFRDTRGSYDILYLIFSILCVLTAAMLAILACWDRTRRRENA